MVIVERYKNTNDGWEWVELGRGRTPGSVVRRVLGRGYGIQPDSGLAGYGAIIHYLPRGGAMWQASVIGKCRWWNEKQA